MLDNRKNKRYRTLAQVRIPHILEGENLLKDISITGCRVESTAYADIKQGTQYQMEIEPESSSKIGNFFLSVEVKWVRSTGYTGEVGFSVIASPKGKHFQRYVDYLAYRSSQP
ncbi:MAG TPA: PilZ domain-containing protein [Treponema sp.]|nr:PilZ domain-containing protein [Treponema sp.]